MDSMYNRILVVDEDQHLLELCHEVFAPTDKHPISADVSTDKAKDSDSSKSIFYDLTTVSQGEHALKYVHEALGSAQPYSVAFVDSHLRAGIDGLETARRIRALDDRIYIVITTDGSDDSVDTIQESIKHDVLLVRKPINRDEFFQLARNACVGWNRNLELQHKCRILLGSDDMDSVHLGECMEKKLTVLFADIRDFTTLSEQKTPQEVFTFINAFLEQVVPIILSHGGAIDKFMGDAVLAFFDGPADNAVAASLDILKALKSDPDKTAWDSDELRVGIGLNTGIVMLGTVGSAERMQRTVIGDTVNSASRIETLTKVYRSPLIISESTHNALVNPSQFQIRFIDRIRVRGKSRPQSIFEVFNHDPDRVRHAKERLREHHEHALACYHMRDIDNAELMLKQCQIQLPNDTITDLYLNRCIAFKQTGVHEGTGEMELQVRWSDDYSINIPEVDEQHKHLLDIINRVSMLVHGDGEGDLNEVLDSLARYTQEHFHTEELLMHKHHYPLFKEHLKEHIRFIEYYQILRDEIVSKKHDKQFLLFKINLFLVDWLINHTTTIDKHMGNYLNRLGVVEKLP
ncbi:MAG: bacteriohemerythrin [Myxococcales bacterium]|nr:MAG: bacteriohemerythrin [Myxococcales bacterium]